MKRLIFIIILTTSCVKHDANKLNINENIKKICIDLQKQTNCPEEDLKDFLEFISRNME